MLELVALPLTAGPLPCQYYRIFIFTNFNFITREILPSLFFGLLLKYILLEELENNNSTGKSTKLSKSHEYRRTEIALSCSIL